MKSKKFYNKIIIIVVCTLFVALNTSAKSEQTKIYAFGFAASFNDSTVYFTQIQPIDSAWVDTKTTFLEDRDDYSYQLRNYMNGIGEAHRTCIILFALKQKDIDKKYVSLKKQYTESGTFIVKYLNLSEFSFKSIPHFVSNAVPETSKKKAISAKNKK